MSSTSISVFSIISHFPAISCSSLWGDWGPTFKVIFPHFCMNFATPSILEDLKTPIYFLQFHINLKYSIMGRPANLVPLVYFSFLDMVYLVSSGYFHVIGANLDIKNQRICLHIKCIVLFHIVFQNLSRYYLYISILILIHVVLSDIARLFKACNCSPPTFEGDSSISFLYILLVSPSKEFNA